MFEIEPVTEWMEQERQRKQQETDRLQQEQRELARLEREKLAVHQQQTTGRNAGQAMRNSRRMASTELNKFKVIRPTAIPVTVAAADHRSGSGTSSSTMSAGLGIASAGVSAPYSENNSAKLPPADGRA